MSTPKYPHVVVPLAGEDGNAFAIIGRVTAALKRAGEREAAEAYKTAAFASESYDALLRLTLDTVSEESMLDADESDDEGECWNCGARTTYDDTVCEDCDEDEDYGCDGHESLDGAHMGESVYCDGSCTSHSA